MSTSGTTDTRLTSVRRIRQQRRRTLLAFGAALALLIVAVTVFTVQHRARDRADAELSQARQTLAAAERQQAHVQQRVHLHEALTRLTARAQTLGLAPSQWSQRRISLRQQSIDRLAADSVLRSTGRGDGHLFAADAFDLSVIRPDEGLFKLPNTNNRALRLTMDGTAFFSTRKRP